MNNRDSENSYHESDWDYCLKHDIVLSMLNIPQL